MLKTHFIEKEFKYDGSQLKSLFAYLEHNILGDSIVSWIGPCHIPFDKMVDGEDFLAQSPIYSDLMLHFIVEIFNPNLISAVLIQRLLSQYILDNLRSLKPEWSNEFKRDGDDVYFKDQKFSISIATVSPVSSLIHLAVNVNNQNTPVKTCALEDFGCIEKAQIKTFAQSVMLGFALELESIDIATKKVNWVR